jgi:hypothetical protein
VRLELVLSDAQVHEIADLVADRLAMHAPPTPSGLVDAQTVADTLGVSRDTVYLHADELGGRRIGDGKRPRWRFDLAIAREAWQPQQPTRTAPRRRRSPDNGTGLLPVHGDVR